jgi:3'(2'), 5'-bisphosphate nucleotidase
MNTKLTTAITAALTGGKEIMNIYQNADFGVEMKADNSPLTLADKAADKVIKQLLSETNIPILSEEGREIPYEERRAWQQFWLVDPLDGTKEFIKRNGEFTVNIALIDRNTPVMGVIYVPVKEELYFAEKTLGAYKVFDVKEFTSMEALLQQAEQLPLEGSSNRSAFTVVASRSHMSLETETFIQSLKEKHGGIETISRGSSLKFCMVAEGVADVYPRFAPTMEWDTGAGHAIAQISGATVFNHETRQPLRYNKDNLLNPWFVVER